MSALALLMVVAALTTVNGQVQNFKGCWNDVATNRDLTFSLTAPGGVNVLNCMMQCRLRTYRYAGIQGTNCYCGQTFGKHGQSKSCKACTDNPQLQCGNTNPLAYSIYDTSPYATPGTPSITVNETANSYTVRCNIISPMPGAVYKVWWKVDGKPLAKEELAQNVNFAELQPSQLFLNNVSIANRYLSCSVAGRYIAANKPNDWGTNVHSAPFYVGLEITDEAGKVLNNQGGISLDEGVGNMTINIRPTLPVDDLVIGLYAKNLPPTKDQICRNTNDMLDQVVFSKCSLQFNRQNWKTPQSVVVMAVEDFTNDAGQKMNIGLEVIKTQTRGKRQLAFGGPINAMNAFPGFNFLVQQMTGKTKRSVALRGGFSSNDPHMTTFDGLKYENQHPGEFILYRHTELPYEVRSLYGQYNSRVTCNCGTAVRVGDDVISIDSCSGTMKVKVFSGNDDVLADGFTLVSKNGGRQYVIGLPHGATVVVTKSFTKFVNVMVTPSPLDIGKVEGLLGNLNGNKADDLKLKTGVTMKYVRSPHAFSLSWRVPKTETLFNGHVPANAVTYRAPKGSFCSCRKGVQTQKCDVSAIQRCVAQGTNLAQRLKERPDRQMTKLPIDYDPTVKPVEPKWPTPKGVTEKQAKAKCEKFFAQSKAVQACKNVLPLKNSVADCMEDIKLTDGMDFARDTLEVYKQECEMLIEEQNVPPPKDSFCVNECSFNGVCTNNTCQCKTGFVGEDCSVSTSNSPKASVDGSCCDVARGAKCDSIKMKSAGYSSKLQYTCLRLNTVDFTDLDISAPGAAKYLNFDLLECAFKKPPTVNARYEVSITTGDSPKEDPGFFAVFDSRCMTCSDSNIKMQANMCYIDGKCRKSKESNPTSANQVCNPAVNQYSWSN